MSSNGSCPNNICPMVVYFQKNVSKGGSCLNNVSKGSSCPNNICAMMVDRFINMYVH